MALCIHPPTRLGLNWKEIIKTIDLYKRASGSVLNSKSVEGIVATPKEVFKVWLNENKKLNVCCWTALTKDGKAHYVKEMAKSGYQSLETRHMTLMSILDGVVSQELAPLV